MTWGFGAMRNWSFLYVFRSSWSSFTEHCCGGLLDRTVQTFEEFGCLMFETLKEKC